MSSIRLSKVNKLDNAGVPARSIGKQGSNLTLTLIAVHLLIVLSDPQLRTAYDEYGEEGLNTKWEVGHRVKTAQEVCASLLYCSQDDSFDFSTHPGSSRD